jgi:hypothetical protein
MIDMPGGTAIDEWKSNDARTRTMRRCHYSGISECSPCRRGDATYDEAKVFAYHLRTDEHDITLYDWSQ